MPTNEVEENRAGDGGAVLVAISGPSCSGKTTLARMLRDAISTDTTSSSTSDQLQRQKQDCRSFIIHEDDFYVTDSEIPVVRIGDRELQDWDCREAIDFKLFEEMLRHIKQTGRMREGFDSKEDTNAVGNVNVDWQAIAQSQEQLKLHAQRFAQQNGTRIVIVDGFLLFAQGLESIMRLFDVRLLLTVDYATMKHRREARSGYVTLEGFWEDPPGYVDDIVWPNYVKDHKFLYHGENVAGPGGLNEDLCRRLGIDVRPSELGEDMTGCFEWAAKLIIGHLDA